MNCEKIFYTIDYIATHMFVDDEMNILLDRTEGLFLYELEAYETVFESFETGVVPPKILFSIKKTDITCVKGQKHLSPIFLSNLKQVALQSLECLAKKDFT